MSLNNAYGTDQTFGNELKESVADQISNLGDVDTPLYNLLGTKTAVQSLHSFLTYNTPRATDFGTVAEGADTTYPTLDDVTRSSNYVQEIEVGFNVSDKQRASENYGYEDAFEYKKMEAMKAWKLAAERSLLKATGVSGASGSAWQMIGMRTAISTNFTSVASGTSLTETNYNDHLQDIYDQNIEDDPVVSMMNMRHKRVVSDFTTGVTKNIDADEYKMIRKIEIYESDVAGEVRFTPHRDITSTDGYIISFQPRGFHKAMLEEPRFEPRAKTGPSDKGAIYGSLTLEYNNEKAGAVLANSYSPYS